MATLTINENPSISDTIVFNLKTPDVRGCFSENPYKLDKIVIYYVERDFSSGNETTYENKNYDLDKLKAAEIAEANVCVSPTDENIKEAKRLREIAESDVSTTPFFFNEAKPVHIVGNDRYPAWLSTDVQNAFANLVGIGEFEYIWQPQGMREGDYFICWTWTPLIAGDSISSHMRFTLKGDTQVTTSIPTHFTDPAKYTTLLERYTPEMFKMVISGNDRTPDVIEKFNNAVADGFSTLEDLGNQIVDLQDSNSIHESLIPYLSNFFNLRLKTNDPTRWRGQTKRAIPLYKMKGTKKGIAEAMEHASIKMLGLVQLWEITSSYTWQEVWKFDGINDSFNLEKVALPIDYDNFELSIRPVDENDWVVLSPDYVEFLTNDGLTTVTWNGSNLSVNPVDLMEGDEIKILYKVLEIPDETAQAIENYIRSLPLMDQRDERTQLYPLKNWNVRVIAENDSMFNLVIPTRHPYHEMLVYGKVRTEFPYSENIYNMEEYNGSIRNSKNPCDIDKNFVDPCTACISSSYNIDLEIENISDDRILEAKEVLQEHTPFHSVLHTFNFLGSMNDFVESPMEEIEALVSISGEEFVVAGDAQSWFNRITRLVETEGIHRGELADRSLVLEPTIGTGYNDEIVMFCPNLKLDNIGLALDASAKMNIFGPSPLEGSYNLVTPRGNTVTVLSSIDEPIDNCNRIFANDNTINNCAFTFDINNSILEGTLCNVTQDNLFLLSDSSIGFGIPNIKTLFDTNQASSWKVSIPAYSGTSYIIADVMPNGDLILVNHGGLPNSATNINYSLLNASNTVIATSVSGVMHSELRAKITALSSGVTPISNVIKSDGNYYFKVNTVEYPVIGFVEGEDDKFYIGNYDAGDIASANLIVDQKIATKEIGYLSHKGMKLQLPGNLENDLEIQNGANSLIPVDNRLENNGFKENFIVNIGADNYFITEIDGNNPSGNTTITLSGPDHYWQTLAAGGTSVEAKIYKYEKKGATISGQQFDLPEHTFSKIDRAGQPVIERIDEEGVVTALNIPNTDQFVDIVRQEESISFTIEYSDGSSEQGEIE